MRVTNKLLSNNFLTDVQRNLLNLNKIQRQMSSMKNFSKPSDDPVNVQRSMQLQSSIDYNAQYAVNIKAAQGWMKTTDTSLIQLNTVLGNIRNNLEKGGGNGGYTQDEMDKVNDEINQEVSQLAQILNTNFEGEYIFGGTAGLSKPVKTSIYDITRSGTDTYKNCVKLEYADKNGNTVNYLPDVVSNGFDIKNWTSHGITFNVNGTDISINNISGSNVDEVVKNLNSKIQNTDGLEDKINVVKTNDGNIKFLAVDSNDIIKISHTTVKNDLTGTIGKQFSSIAQDNIEASKNIEVSQGVVLDYNTNAVDVMKYGSGDYDDIRFLMDRIEHHMAGQVLSDKKQDGTAVVSTDSGAINMPDSDGTAHYYAWINNQSEAKKQLTNEDITDIDEASKQVLKADSQIGAKETRMDGLSSQNSASKVDMTDVLSKTEDIDISEKTIEYATMLTVYEACLQTGGKVIQPTLLDYVD
ncbi:MULTISPECIES: flagellar hook-associated protein FlgL [Clostridium]|uniref:Flagellar hook-associated protein FlgL n=1 Tax=Clostridium lapidicellarium TaxID=3240931 RepID=A0ABV4DUZ5_9CLOT